MLLGFALFWVGAVLCLNGIWLLGKIGDREIAVIDPVDGSAILNGTTASTPPTGVNRICKAFAPSATISWRREGWPVYRSSQSALSASSEPSRV